MRGGVVCYLERSHAGSLLTRVRLMAIGLSRSWSAPEPTGDPTGAAVPAPAPEGGPALATVQSAARWVAETLQSVGVKRIASVCVDSEGSICAWLSAPSADDQIIQATIAQSGHDPDNTGAGLGAGRLLAMAAPGGNAGLGVRSDTSIQALATSGPAQANHNGHSQPRRRLLPGRAKDAPAAAGPLAVRRNRYAFLAIPDAPVRVFLDELDSRGIEVQAVTTLWHAMASAWTPSEESGPRASASAGPSGHIVSTSSPTSAVVMIEPSAALVDGEAGGRLIWSWSRSGELLAGGTMRLKCLSRRAQQPVAAPDAASPIDGALAKTEPVERRASPTPAPETGADDQPPIIELAQADAGRLAVDWLAWSAQLGHCPRRIVLLATPTATDEDGGGPASLGRHLGRAWPNSTIDAAVYDDPTGVTIGRLAGLRSGADQESAAEPLRDTVADDSRSALLSLSARPGRADRRMLQWAALGLVGAALLIGVLGWRLEASSGAIAAQEKATRDQTASMLASIAPIVPNAASPYPKAQQDALETKRNELRDQAKKIHAPQPVLEETLRALDALKSPDSFDVINFSISFVSGNITIEVPDGPKAAEVGPRIWDALKARPGRLFWTGQSSSFSTQPGKRRYALTGMWPADEAPGGTAR